jgi:putative CRISPR-associated protein (TIGR02620 family)
LNNSVDYQTADPDSYWACQFCHEMYQRNDLGVHRICPECRKTKTVIVSRHKGLVEWLALQGITGKVINHVANPEQLKGKLVYGVLPLGLAAETMITYAVELPNLSKEMRGRDLSLEEMVKAGACLRGFKVECID